MVKMADIKDQMLLYHLTSLSNIGSILAEGLKPRSALESFEDVADHEIIANRRHLSLEDYVPFHWFARNPFDGRVQEDRPDELFVLITVRRTLAATGNWKVIPHHPLAAANIALMDYADGIAAIDWEAMNQRDYHNAHSKSVCMAECLSPSTVSPVNFFKFFVSCDASAASVEQEKLRHGVRVEVTVNGNMFLS
jgi:hypothetical protein